MMGQDEHETDKKNGKKKTIQAFELLNSDVRARNQLEMTMLGQDEHETDTKNRISTNSTYELMNTLEMLKKTCQALESFNFDVRDGSQLEITMLGQDEHETDTKNLTSTNSASELTNPIEMEKKHGRL